MSRIHQSYESKLRKVLNINILEDQANNDHIGEDKNSLNSIVNKIKSKIHNEETTRAEKLQILTLVPSEWSRKKAAEIFEVSERTVRKARNLEEHGIFFLPPPPKGKSTAIETINKVQHWSFIKTMKIAKYYVELKTELVSKRMYINKSD